MHRLPVSAVLRAVSSAVLLSAVASAAAQPPTAQTAPLIEEDSRTKVSDHVYVILDEGRSFIPNVGIVVGSKATLIVDTGMGDRNGRIILGEARKLSGNTQF